MRIQLVKDTCDASIGTNIQEKVAICGEKVMIWGKEITGNFDVRIKECKLELKYLR